MQSAKRLSMINFFFSFRKNVDFTRSKGSGMSRGGMLISACFRYGGLGGIMILLFLQPAFGQAQWQADQYFDADQFNKAAILYEQIFQDDATDYQAAFRLAECYRRLFEYEKAQRYYQLVRTKDAADFPLSIFYYGLMLKYNQQYEEALSEFDQFIKGYQTPDLSRFVDQAKKEKQGCYLALVEKNETPSFSFFRLAAPVNSEYNEYGPAIFRNDSALVITSARAKTRKRINNRSGEGFTDNLLFVKDQTNWALQNKEQGFDVTNTRWSDGSGTFNRAKDKYYFTSCREDGSCRIYLSQLQGGKWQDPVVLNQHINLPGSNAKHPALSGSGDTLFFVSDRPGGQGGTDIWMSIQAGEEAWGSPVNLGKEINTSFNEISPFYVSQGNLLVFASNGHEGLGGMDIYLAEGLGTVTIFLEDLGKPFNTSKDDCYLVMGDKTGYLASNRDGNFDIFTFLKPEGVKTKDFLLGNFNEQPAPGTARVFQQMITDPGITFPLANESLFSVRSSEKERLRGGSTRFILSSDVSDIMLDKFRRESEREKQKATAPDSLSFSTLAVADSIHYGSVLLTFNTKGMKEQERGELNGKLVMDRTDSALTAVTLNLVTSDGALAKIATTNEQGDFRFVNLDPATVYHIFVDTKSVPGHVKAAIRKVNLKSYGNEVNVFRYENIYYDFNQSGLRKEARVVLDELAAFYRQHPDIRIEINAFTDSTGDAAYNLRLSQERGQSAFDYLIRQGVDRSDLVINAQGVSTTIHALNPLVSQQLNRRVEFEVIGKGIDYQPQYETRILKSKTDISALSEALGMPVEELKAINGLEKEELQAFKPCRIRKTANDKAQAFFYDILKK